MNELSRWTTLGVGHCWLNMHSPPSSAVLGLDDKESDPNLLKSREKLNWLHLVWDRAREDSNSRGVDLLPFRSTSFTNLFFSTVQLSFTSFQTCQARRICRMPRSIKLKGQLLIAFNLGLVTSEESFPQPQYLICIYIFRDLFIPTT